MVLPQSLQEKMTEEAEAKKTSKANRTAVQGIDGEERKRDERKNRRASIAVGVMSAIAKQGLVLNPSVKRIAAEGAAPAKQRRSQRNSSLKAALKQNFRSSIFTGAVSGLANMPSGIKIPFLDSQASSGISSAGLRFDHTLKFSLPMDVCSIVYLLYSL